MKLALHGATGRMGLSVARLSHAAHDIQIVGAAAHHDDEKLGSDIGVLAGVENLGVAVSADLSSALLGADVVIDFSLAPAVANLTKTASQAGVAIVSGTTGLDDQAIAALKQASQRVPVLWARNMSLGIQVLSELVEQAVRRLGSDFDAEILEIHHKYKVDSPSGTAKRLGHAVREVRPDLRDVCGREGNVGAREQEELGMFAVRGGDVIGDHTVFLFGPGERLELTHRATNRDLFASGAIRAARFLVGQKPGMYTVADVVRDPA